VIVLDYAEVDFPVAQAISVDLRDREAIDAPSPRSTDRSTPSSRPRWPTARLAS
jgi:hypothetical protein